MTNLASARRRAALASASSSVVLALASIALVFEGDAAAQGRVTFGGSAQPDAPAPTAAAPTETSDPVAAGSAAEKEWAERDRLINEPSTLTGGSGLLRLQHAQSGAPGQFRLGFTTEWFSAGFLCSANFPCPNPRGSTPLTSDTMNHIGATISLSITMAKIGAGFLEGYASTGGYANSDSANRPSLLQVLGDTNFGLKYGAPLSKVFWLGAFTELWLINGTGSVGLDGGSTGFKLGPIATLDLRGTKSRTPLRFSFNAFYTLDNTANVLTDTEVARKKSVTRIERFGLNVNRVDHFDMRIGGEFFAAEDRVRPFIEYNIAIPNNRQNYACKSNNPSGDHCLANDAIAPSTLTIGGRFFPWKHGFSLLAGLDIGVTGTTTFIEEVAPTPPWTLFIGAGWAIDTWDRPPVRVTKTVEKLVEVDRAPKWGHIKGFVHEKDKQEGVASAIVGWKDRPELTSLATGADGRFTTQPLKDGAYAFTITADGYKPGECATTLSRGGSDAPIDCVVEALPKVGNVVGTVRDSDSNAPVGNVAIRMTDEKKKDYQITADGSGAFRFENVPPGPVEIRVEADGYLASVQSGEVKVRTDNRLDIGLKPKPRNATVQITAREIIIKQQVQFGTGSAVILPDSFALLTEVADAFIRNPRIKKVEVQGHTDNQGPADYNKTLSQQRADAVRLWLTQHGVDGSRLVGVGYGLERPLVPNVTQANKARNRRVQFIILEQEPAVRAN